MRYVLLMMLAGCAYGGPGTWTPDAGDDDTDAGICLAEGVSCIAFKTPDGCCGDLVCHGGRCVSQ